MGGTMVAQIEEIPGHEALSAADQTRIYLIVVVCPGP